jgi:tetratricopeptide (TPR) repeat protein
MRMHWSRPVLVVGIAVVATAAAAVLLRPWADDEPPPATSASTSERASGLTTLVARTEGRVARVPGDWRAWADLGMARVQLARISGDPAQYPRAEEALRTSLDLRADDNAPALTGMAALAAARHDFGAAETHARKAIAADAYSADAYGALADALIELGRPKEGFAAVQKMVDLRPDTGSYARASYTFELRGDLPKARALMGRAREVATDPSDITFTLTHLGGLAVVAGDLDAATEAYAEGLSRQPGDAGLLFGRARLAYARGDDAAAIADARAAVKAAPTPEHATALGDLLTAGGDEAGAKDAYDLVRAAAALTAPDVDLVLFWADNGEADRAATAARTIYEGRRSTVVADALAWALHRSGRSEEALPYADRALALGTHDARAHFHRGVIRAAVGDKAGARADLTEALRIDPRFSPRDAPAARAALAELGA